MNEDGSKPGETPVETTGDDTQPAEAPVEAPVGLLAGLRTRWALVSLSTLLYWSAAHSLRPLVTLRLDELGSSDAKTGLIVSSYAFFSLLLALPAGRVIDRVGVIRIFGASFTAMAVVGVGYAVAATPDQIFVLQIVNGVVELFVWLALQALISHAGKGDFLTRQLSLFSLAWGVGIAGGPVLGTAIYARYGFAPLGGVYAILSLLALVGLAAPYRGREAATAGHTKAEASSLATLRRIGARPAVKGVLLSSFVALYIQSIRLSFYPLLLERAGVTVPRIGVLLSVIGITSLVIRVPLPALLRRWDAGRVLVWTMWLCIVPMALTPWIGSYWLLLFAAVLIGAGYGVNPPVTVQLMAVHTEPAERGLAMGLRLVSNRLAQVAQPVLFGGIISVAGMALAFPISGLLLAGLTVWTASEASRMTMTARSGSG